MGSRPAYIYIYIYIYALCCCWCTRCDIPSVGKHCVLVDRDSGLGTRDSPSSSMRLESCTRNVHERTVNYTLATGCYHGCYHVYIPDTRSLAPDTRIQRAPSCTFTKDEAHCFYSSLYKPLFFSLLQPDCRTSKRTGTESSRPPFLLSISTCTLLFTRFSYAL